MKFRILLEAVCIGQMFVYFALSVSIYILEKSKKRKSMFVLTYILFKYMLFKNNEVFF